MATVLNYKTENKLYADFIGCIKQALEKFGIEGWEVRQLKQAFKFTTIKPTLFVTVTDYNQLGRQYRQKIKNTVGLDREYLAKKEARIRFSATRRQLAQDTVETYNGLDILEFLRAYFQSGSGIEYLASLGYAQYRADAIRQQDFVNDSDDFELMPYFDCTYLYTDNWAEDVGIINKIVDNVYKI